MWLLFEGVETLEESMQAAVLSKPYHINIERRKIPKPKEDEILINVISVGVCGSDVHYYEYGRIGNRMIKKPLVQGHECAGIIKAIGNKVTTLKVGDRVVIEPGIPCRKCSYCKNGNYHLCPEVRFLSSPPVDGALSEYITHPADFAFKIPKNISFDIASLVEPTSVGIHAAEVTSIRPGNSVFIMGMGPVGLTMVLVAKAFGAKNIIVSDVEPLRLEMAERMGASMLLDALDNNIQEKVDKYNEEIDVVIDTSGKAQALNLAVKVLKAGGKIGSIGFPSTDEISISLLRMIQKEITLYPIYRYKNTFEKGLFILSKQLELAEQLITHHFPLDEVHSAFEKARTDKSKCIKVMVHPNK